MLKVLVPVDGGNNSLHVVRHVLHEFKSNPALEIHLLNVQPPYSSYITRFIDEAMVAAEHQEASQKALQPSRQMLDAAGVPYAVHLAVGKKAVSITDAARQLQCDHIVMGTARKSSLVRVVEDSVTNQVLELTTVPLLQIAGDPASKAERYGIPAGVGAGLTWLAVAASE